MRSRVLPAVHHLNKSHWDLQRRSARGGEMTFSDRITCVRVVAGLPKTSSEVMPLDEDLATALQLPLCSDDGVLSMLYISQTL